MSSTNIDIARTYFEAVQTADMATLGGLLDEAIVWHQPGANQFSGDHKGRDAVFAMLGRMMETSQGTFAIDRIDTLMANGDLVAATIHFSGRRDDASMSMDGNGSIERALMSERLPVELPPILPALAQEYLAKLDSRSLDDTRDFFWLGGEREDIPPRTAYAMGALVADDIVGRKGLAAALKLGGRELRREVGLATARLSRPGTRVDWSTVCVMKT